MMVARVRRGGFILTLRLEGGQAAICVSTSDAKSPELKFLSCSIIGLHNVLSGVEYLAVTADQQCLIRRQDKNIELVWKGKRSETVIRLSLTEYRNLLKAGGDTGRNAA